MFTVCAYLTRRWLETPLPVRGTGYMYGVSYREGCLAVQNHGQEMQNLLETTREQNR